MGAERPAARELNAALRYIKRLLPAMNLAEWKVYLSDLYSPRGYVKASISPEPNVREATMHLGTAWDELEDHEKGQALVHELLHLANADICQFFTRVIVPELAEPARRIAARAYNDHDELFIDRLATVLYERLPQYGRG